SIRLSTREGVFAEPASVAAYVAGLDIAVERDWRVMVLMTSTGLKTVPARRRILIGETKIDVLRLLNSYGRMHGYLIWKKLGGRVSPQAVYSALKWLESRGFISSYERGRYRFYGLTDEGRRILELLKYIFSRY
nr:helix-turn-helix transcriptional regulator [Desulfurococcales archaeon]